VSGALFPPDPVTRDAEDRLTARLAEADRRVRAGKAVPDFDRAAFDTALAAMDFAQPRSLAELCDWTIEQLEHGVVHMTHPRYLGLFNPAPSLPARLADRIVTTFNPQLATATTSPAAVAIEAHVTRAFARRAGLGDAAAGHFTSGGSEANATALICALTASAPGFAEHGSRAFAGTPTFYISADSHLAWIKIAHAAGLGRSAARLVPTDALGRINAAELAAMIGKDQADGAVPVMIVATAGTTNAGAIDDLAALRRIADDTGAWFHVDAAWGGALLVSDRLRPMLAGIHAADSITIDAHKWLATTMGCGMILVACPAILNQSFNVRTSFMPSHTPAADPLPHHLAMVAPLHGSAPLPRPRRRRMAGLRGPRRTRRGPRPTPRRRARAPRLERRQRSGHGRRLRPATRRPRPNMYNRRPRARRGPSLALRRQVQRPRRRPRLRHPRPNQRGRYRPRRRHPRTSPHLNRAVIPHIDDLGASLGANRAFLELVGQGAVTCGSVMVPGAWFRHLAAAAAGRDLDIGVHLTLTSEWRTCRWAPISTTSRTSGLIDTDGYFWPDIASLGRHVVPEAAEAEMRAQIERAIAAGLQPTHVDAHMAAAMLPGLLEIQLRLAEEFALFPVLPRSIDWAPDPALYRATLAALDAQGAPIIDHCRGTLPVAPAALAGRWRRLIADLPPGTTHLALHATAPGDFAAMAPDHAVWRTAEYRMLRRGLLPDLCRDHGVALDATRSWQRRSRATSAGTVTPR